MGAFGDNFLYAIGYDVLLSNAHTLVQVICGVHQIDFG